MEEGLEGRKDGRVLVVWGVGVVRTVNESQRIGCIRYDPEVGFNTRGEVGEGRKEKTHGLSSLSDFTHHIQYHYTTLTVLLCKMRNRALPWV